jgi:catechol 2,3-dioxygenase
MPYRISRLGHVEVQSIDLDRDVDYYLNVIGLHQTGREGNTVYLKGWDERHTYSFILTQAERPGSGCQRRLCARHRACRSSQGGLQ